MGARARAGGSAPVPFSPEAIALIAKASRGIPRVVNCICDNALLLAYAGEEEVVTSGHVYNVLRDLDLGEPEPTRNNGTQVARRNINQTLFGESELLTSNTAPRTSEGSRAATPPAKKPSATLGWADELESGPVRSRRPKP